MSSFDYSIKYKKILLDTFSYLIGFLNSHKFRWWGAYGTLIGAVRHHGLIPWDDDIDIWMPREDYERFIQLKEEFDNDRYCIEHISKDNGYCARFAKVMDCHTSIQVKRYIPSVIGVFIDIFPLDSLDGTKEEMLDCLYKIHSVWDNYFGYVKHYSLSDFVKTDWSMKRIFRMIHENRMVSVTEKNKALESALLLEKQVSTAAFGKTKNCISLYGYCDERGIFKTEWFHGFVEVQYEDMTIKIPSGYHELLTCIYGDYMTPPPIEKRIPRHKPYYINLKERLSLQEIAKRVKSGESEVY